MQKGKGRLNVDTASASGPSTPLRSSRRSARLPPENTGLLMRNSSGIVKDWQKRKEREEQSKRRRSQINSNPVREEVFRTNRPNNQTKNIQNNIGNGPGASHDTQEASPDQAIGRSGSDTEMTDAPPHPPGSTPAQLENENGSPPQRGQDNTGSNSTNQQSGPPSDGQSSINGQGETANQGASDGQGSTNGQGNGANQGVAEQPPLDRQGDTGSQGNTNQGGAGLPPSDGQDSTNGQGEAANQAMWARLRDLARAGLSRSDGQGNTNGQGDAASQAATGVPPSDGQGNTSGQGDTAGQGAAGLPPSDGRGADSQGDANQGGAGLPSSNGQANTDGHDSTGSANLTGDGSSQSNEQNTRQSTNGIHRPYESETLIEERPGLFRLRRPIPTRTRDNPTRSRVIVEAGIQKEIIWVFYIGYKPWVILSHPNGIYTNYEMVAEKDLPRTFRGIVKEQINNIELPRGNLFKYEGYEMERFALSGVAIERGRSPQLTYRNHPYEVYFTEVDNPPQGEEGLKAFFRTAFLQHLKREKTQNAEQQLKEAVDDYFRATGQEKPPSGQRPERPNTRQRTGEPQEPQPESGALQQEPQPGSGARQQEPQPESRGRQRSRELNPIPLERRNPEELDDIGRRWQARVDQHAEQSRIMLGRMAAQQEQVAATQNQNQPPIAENDRIFIREVEFAILRDPQPSDSEECCICRERWQQGPNREFAVRAPCGHLVGDACVAIWLDGCGPPHCHYCRRSWRRHIVETD